MESGLNLRESHSQTGRVECDEGFGAARAPATGESCPAKLPPLGEDDWNNPGNKQKPFIWDVALTFGAESAVLVSSLLLISVLGRWLGPVALAEYLLVRRVSTWFLAGSRLGLATALPRYVALASGTKARGRECPAYFLGGAATMMISAVFVGVILVVGRHGFADLFFGRGNHGTLVLAMALLLVGTSTQSSVYGYYRGILDMVRANAVTVAALAVLPLAVVVGLASTKSVPLIVGAIGGLTVVVSVLFVVPLFRRIPWDRLPPLAPKTSELLRYGLPRVPGDFGQAALLAVGPVVAAHYVSMARLSSLLLGLGMLMVIGYAVSPLGVVLLSKVSIMLGKGAMESVRARLEHLAVAVPELSVFACVQLLVFADIAVRIWVGSKFLGDIDVIRLLILAIPPYLYYVMLRGTVDAAAVRAHNAESVLIALGVHLVLLFAAVTMVPARFLLEAVAASLLLSLVVLGFLTLRIFCRLYGVRLAWCRSAPAVGAALGLGGVAWLFRRIHGSPVQPIEVCLLECGLCLAYLGILRRLGSSWVDLAWKMAFPKRVA